MSFIDHDAFGVVGIPALCDGPLIMTSEPCQHTKIGLHVVILSLK